MILKISFVFQIQAVTLKILSGKTFRSKVLYSYSGIRPIEHNLSYYSTLERYSKTSANTRQSSWKLQMPCLKGYNKYFGILKIFEKNNLGQGKLETSKIEYHYSVSTSVNETIIYAIPLYFFRS